MQRALWKGAISFGLVHVPVEMFSAEKRHELDLTMLDRRDFVPIGYRRVNKKTGKEVAWDDIVRAYEYEPDQYVVLSDADLKRANVEATRTIDILAFVSADEVSPAYFDQPYYLLPIRGGEKAYALLRETLRKANRLAIAQIVIRTKQHLASLYASDEVIVLDTLRYGDELRPLAELETPRGAAHVRISEKELQMALALVEGMSEPWNPSLYRDAYRDDVMALVKKKIKSGETKTIADADSDEPEVPATNIIDLTALLKRSIASRSGKTGPKTKAARPTGAARAAKAKPAARRSRA